MNKATILLAGFCLVVATAQANEEFEESSYYDVYLGNTETTWVAGGQTFNYTTLGATYGYQFSEYVSLEGTAMFSLNEDTDELFSAGFGQTVKTSFSSLGGYLAARTKGDIYLAGKVGLAMSTFTYSAAGFQDESESDFGLAYGMSLGFEGDELSFELGYTKLPDVDDPLFSGITYESESISLSLVFPIE